MNNGRFIKIDRVLENVYRDYGFEDMDWMNAVEWAGECLDLIGAPRTYIEKSTDGHEDLGHPEPITIEDYRGKLPCDMYKLIQAFRCIDGEWIPMRVSTDNSFISYFCSSTKDIQRDSEYTYKLNKDHIFVNFEEGEVVLAYWANPTDERGYPMIPDNIKYVKACQSYIGLKMIQKKMIQGKQIAPSVIQFMEQEYYFNVAAADSSARIPTIDDMESWKNNFIRLYPNINSHRTAFRADGAQEKRFNNSSNNSKNSNNLSS